VKSPLIAPNGIGMLFSTTQALAALEEKIRKCRKCRLWMGAMNAVPGEGPADAKVMLIGQNPGTEEDKTGRPFMGKSGKFLNSILENNGIGRDLVFITNIVKHKTPDNRFPSKDEISACKVYILEQMKLINPRIVVLMGTLAWKEGPKAKNTIYIRTVHPAAAMRFPKMRERFRSDFKLLKKTMERRRR
jgi:uracil-DNA glycosylase family 4